MASESCGTHKRWRCSNVAKPSEQPISEVKPVIMLLVCTSTDACMKDSRAVLVDFEEGLFILGKLRRIFFVSFTVEKMRLRASM
jgi:hypothetical protein